MAEKKFYDDYKKIIDVLLDKHAIEVSVHNLSEVSGFADVFIVAIARSDLNARTLLDAASDAFDEMGITYRVEGENSAKWILIDAGNAIVNILTLNGAKFYRLDSLWGDTETEKFDGYDD